MQSNQQFIIDKIIPIAVNLMKMVELECDNLDIAAPRSVKHALIVNTLHGMFSVKMEGSNGQGLSNFYAMIADHLTLEKDVLLLVAEEFEKRNNNSFKQNMN